jgi:hypothetical protein
MFEITRIIYWNNESSEQLWSRIPFFKLATEGFKSDLIQLECKLEQIIGL